MITLFRTQWSVWYFVNDIVCSEHYCQLVLIMCDFSTEPLLLCIFNSTIRISVYPHFSNQLPVLSSPDDLSTNSYYSFYEHLPTNPEFYDPTTSTTTTKKPRLSYLSGWKDKFLSMFKYNKKNHTKPTDEWHEQMHELPSSLQGISFILHAFIFKHNDLMYLSYSELPPYYICLYKKGYEYPNHDHSDSYSTHSVEKGGSKEMGLKDLFDIALTTLAFLSFGMFVLQVLMCVTMVRECFLDCIFILWNADNIFITLSRNRITATW